MIGVRLHVIMEIPDQPDEMSLRRALVERAARIAKLFGEEVFAVRADVRELDLTRTGVPQPDSPSVVVIDEEGALMGVLGKPPEEIQ